MSRVTVPPPHQFRPPPEKDDAPWIVRYNRSRLRKVVNVTLTILAIAAMVLGFLFVGFAFWLQAVVPGPE